MCTQEAWRPEPAPVGEVPGSRRAGAKSACGWARNLGEGTSEPGLCGPEGGAEHDKGTRLFHLHSRKDRANGGSSRALCEVVSSPSPEVCKGLV